MKISYKKMPQLYLKTGDVIGDEEGNIIQDDWEVFRETIRKQYEYLLCVIGQERPLINGKRRSFTNITMGEIAEYCGFDNCYYLSLNQFIYLEKEWGYAMVDWNHEYEGGEYGSSK